MRLSVRGALRCRAQISETLTMLGLFGRALWAVATSRAGACVARREVESSLHEQLTDHLNAEIVARTIKTREEAAK